LHTELNDVAKFFGLSFSALLPLINPVGDALILLGLVGHAPRTVYRELAKKIAISTALFLLAIEFIGTALLRFFGIPLPIMQVAGGLVLAAMGWKLLHKETEDKPDLTSQEPGGTSPTFDYLKRKIFYPFTFPLTADPACIVVMITLSAHATAKEMGPSLAAHAGIGLGVLAVSVPVYLCYANAPAITARLSAETANGILRVIAFVLLCIGVHIFWNGAEAELRMLLSNTRTSMSQ
jgi:multiple antibiotic resistance protein